MNPILCKFEYNWSSKQIIQCASKILSESSFDRFRLFLFHIFENWFQLKSLLQLSFILLLQIHVFSCPMSICITWSTMSISCLYHNFSYRYMHFVVSYVFPICPNFIIHNTLLYSSVCGIIWTFARNSERIIWTFSRNDKGIIWTFVRNGKGYVLRVHDALDYICWSFRNG